jgi:energy-coupling factor transporter transmembrane protein EcfT
LAAFCLAGALLLPGIWSSYLFFALVLLPFAVWGRVAGPLLGALWKIVLPFAVSVFLIQGLFWTAGTPIASLGPLSLKQEGIEFAVASTGRIALVMGSFLLLSLATRPDDLMIALSQRGMPHTVTYILLASIQIVPSFQARAGAIMDAQRSRGLETEGSLRQRVKALLPLVEPLILGSIIAIDERAIALEARAFSRQGSKTFLRVVSDSRQDRFVRWAFLAGILIMAIFRVAMWLQPYWEASV